MKMAEEAGVKISLHPKDQLVKAMHGISRVLTNTGEIMDFLEVVDSPANEFMLRIGCSEINLPRNNSNVHAFAYAMTPSPIDLQ